MKKQMRLNRTREKKRFRFDIQTMRLKNGWNLSILSVLIELLITQLGNYIAWSCMTWAQIINVSGMSSANVVHPSTISVFKIRIGINHRELVMRKQRKQRSCIMPRLIIQKRTRNGVESTDKNQIIAFSRHTNHLISLLWCMNTTWKANTYMSVITRVRTRVRGIISMVWSGARQTRNSLISTSDPTCHISAPCSRM